MTAELTLVDDEALADLGRYAARARALDADGAMRKINDREALRLRGQEWAGDEPVPLEDAERADEAFSILMGEQVEPRKEFIERNAKYARLDV